MDDERLARIDANLIKLLALLEKWLPMAERLAARSRWIGGSRAPTQK